MNRQDGYYWVKIGSAYGRKLDSPKWCICRWYMDGPPDDPETLSGWSDQCEVKHVDSDILEINETRIPSPEEVMRTDVDCERNEVTITYKRDK